MNITKGYLDRLLRTRNFLQFHQTRLLSTQLVDLLMNVGLTREKSNLVLAELLKTGLPESQIPGFIKNIGPSGLDVFIQSMERSSINREAPSVILSVNVPKERHSFELSGNIGSSLKDIAQETELGSYLECACGGVMACSTCHVILEPNLYSELEPPCEAEQDMLDLAYGVQDTSRLGCQLVLNKKFNNTIITIPDGVNNYW